ncbi:HET-domain-containing protein [Aspergillus eucalypticola CBS 122712]|uniref:HET-domain-containing protein n=1 Tax=Aspergillus eucalypticola (strain CBS 122712 / IBT 29274) TaxID=1448314 RepID=A0A317W7T2_ASPEC|nr:HET-domain-containing protein [Aspergillus eucalypticola CBS 122712]PWY82694.1 HET-domain-containing protein [Aspergillus eucalypticola CBS 122712]
MEILESYPSGYVCDRCWETFFNTKAFEQCFTLHQNDAHYNQIRAETTTTVHEIKDAACNWCAYIRKDRITISLSPSTIPSCTPTGRNIFYLSISCDATMEKWRGAQDPASDYVTARRLRTDTDIKEWLKNCKEHKCCRTLHLIEVCPPGRQHARVLESKDLRDFPKLSHSNYIKFTEGLDEETLPPTIRDALATTRNLSIPYLWIDALCIIQDSEEDKTKEIAQMKGIYASSAVTIVAASAESVSAGFLYPRVHQETYYTIPVRLQPGVFGTIFVNELDAVCYDERLEPISKRGWTMQEQLLSNCILSFTTRTIMWRCRAGIKTFGDSLYFPHDLDTGYNDHDEKYSFNLHTLLLSQEEAFSNKDKALSCWLRLVTAYSIRVTSLERDRLNALAGLASHPSFCQALGPSYFAGLWQYNLTRQLTWRASTWHRSLAEDETISIQRPARYQAPSWSWASLKGGIVHFDFSYGEEDTMHRVICDILDCSTTPASPRLNPFGEILSAQLRLRAPARKAWFKPSTSNIFMLSKYSCESSKVTTLENGKANLAEAFQTHVDDFKLRYPDVNLNEEPEATHGADSRNMCGICDETAYHEYYLVLCVAVTFDDEISDGVQGLLLIQEDDERSIAHAFYVT